MDLEWTPTDLAFRDEVRTFFSENLSDDLRAAGSRMTSVYADHAAQMAWHAIVYKKGWAAPAWPREHGGCEWSVTQRYIFSRERIDSGAPPLSPMGIQMCGPALIGHGTDAQKAYFLPSMLSGEHFWCQGYSEPAAGSDLAALQMRGRIDHDMLVCSGSKIWVTHANVADWIFCLVRTGNYDRPQNGISFVLIDMRSSGIEVRPIVSPAGESIQNQIFFDDVRVPIANVVGDLDHGWTVAKYLLEFERGGVAYAPGLHTRLDEIEAFIAQVPVDGAPNLAADPVFGHKLAAARIRIQVLEVYEWRAMGASSSTSPGISGSVMKILGSELSQHLTELALEAAGAYGRGYQPAAGRPGGPIAFDHNPNFSGPRFAALAPLRYLNERASSIYAGSNEIQRNILAKALLRL